MADQTIRQAVLAAVDVEPTGQASHGEGYFEPGPGIMLPQTAWNSDVSAELYDQGDPERARQLLEEAGYDGTPIRILCTQEDLGDYNAAVVVQQQMDAACERLRWRGLLDQTGFTEQGLRFRGGLEAQTDTMQQSIIDAIGPDLERHIKQLDVWSNALVAVGGAPPNPAKRAAG